MAPQEPELREVITACMKENGMKFDDKTIGDMVNALYRDAIGSGDSNGITINELKTQMAKHDGLLENLSLSIGKWLVPAKAPKPKTLKQKLAEKIPRQLTPLYFQQNWQLVSFIVVVIFGITIALFIQRAYYFREFSMLSGFTPNPFYMLSRAFGEFSIPSQVMSIHGRAKVMSTHYLTH